MVWMFFAIGPGSIFGNFIFGKPNKGYDSWMLGMPSIWAWQIIWWALGVGVIWFLANKLKMSTEPETEIKASSSDQVKIKQLPKKTAIAMTSVAITFHFEVSQSPNYV